ncbi:Uncharacterised protein [Porphyromonas macacae]|uniref:Knr4/Smi1-like domain-containing protein n=1 Tax=Porphyromonas macacae TaxID=28115 RepID=A0A379E6T0_9PORP|nr:SMI1/KNR4 family protein [Porphyromonas macacae]SUB88398.1 Uncharacterised protein [Porphyromonas macacae]
MKEYKMVLDKKLNVVVSMEFYLEKNSDIITNGDISTLHSFTFKNGRKFPSSYISFVEKYGYGLSCGLFIIYIPMDNYPDSFFIRSKEIILTYQDVLDDEEKLWFDIEPDLKYEDLKNLIPFGMSENGHYLFWDIMSKEKKDEMNIYITDFRGIGFLKVANDLYDFFEKVVSKSKYKEVLPFTENALPNIFQVFKI